MTLEKEMCDFTCCYEKPTKRLVFPNGETFELCDKHYDLCNIKGC
jgi:hypothetical protein